MLIITVITEELEGAEQVSEGAEFGEIQARAEGGSLGSW